MFCRFSRRVNIFEIIKKCVKFFIFSHFMTRLIRVDIYEIDFYY